MSKEKRFLITTALEDSWVDDQPALFLGEWCRMYTLKDKWLRMDAVVLSYHWDQSDKLNSDYKYLNDLYERILIDLVSLLNNIHKVNHSAKYWRVLIGPWIAVLAHVLYDRWLSIQNAQDSFEITGTIALDVNKDNLVANDMEEFDFIIGTDEWNHNIFLEIINTLNLCQVTLHGKSEEKYKPLKVKSKLHIKSKILEIYSKVVSYFPKNQNFFLIDTYLSKFDELLLQFKLGQFPKFWSNEDPFQYSLNKELRNWEIQSPAQNPFEEFLLRIIPQQIPKVVMEGYKQLVDQADNLSWPESPKLIYTSNVLWFQSVSMAYTAEKMENGAKLYYGQHGGGYGVSGFSFAEDHERRIADKYLTFGWSDKSESSVKPIGMSNINNIRLKNFNDNKRLLLITLNASRYSFRLGSETTRNFIDYFEDYFSFTSFLDDQVRSNMMIRLHSWDMGWNQNLRWIDNFPNIKLDLGVQEIQKLMIGSRLVVHTYNSTGILQTLALGVPSILFYDLKSMPLREEAIPYFNELKKVGIFHTNVESAAVHVDEIWEDVDLWWNSYEVKAAVTNFNNQYCYQSDNITNSIKNIIQENSNGQLP